MAFTGGKTQRLALASAIALVVGFAAFIAAGVANPRVQVHGNPAQPTYVIPPAEPGMEGERISIGPASIILPPRWELDGDPLAANADPGDGTAPVMESYFLIPAFDPALSCSLHVSLVFTPVPPEEWAAARIQEGRALQYESEVSSDSDLGFADWSGDTPMIYVTNTRTYGDGIPERHLAIETVDSTGRWSVAMLIPGNGREPHEVPCFQILRSLQVS